MLWLVQALPADTGRTSLRHSSGSQRTENLQSGGEEAPAARPGIVNVQPLLFIPTARHGAEKRSVDYIASVSG